MSCCFGRGSRVRDDASGEHDVYLYPAASDGEVLFQYGGTLRPELVYGAGASALHDGVLTSVDATDALAASAALAQRRRGRGAMPPMSGVTRRELERVAPEHVIGRTSALALLSVTKRRAAARRNLSSIEKEKFGNIDIEKEKSEQDGDCSICLQPFVKGERKRVLPCKHGYHSPCIQQWLATSILCPVCMQNVVHRAPEPEQSADGTSTDV